jgi:hypothetical protein
MRNITYSNAMKLRKAWIVPGLIFLGLISNVMGSTIYITMERKTMPIAEWEERYYADSNLLFGGYQGSDDYSVTADGNTIHHVFEYRNGYDQFSTSNGN